MPIDYEVLRIIWWGLLGVLLIGFAIMDGFDLGVAFWLPFIAKKDMDRSILINAIAPTWEGNQVWFILGGGAIFAAWPALYAVSFSGFYFAMLIILLALILRPVGFKYRSKLDNSTWRSMWDKALFISGTVPAIIFGVAVGNVLQGVPFHYDQDLMPYYTGSFWALLNPFALLCGVLSLCMLAMHGASYLLIKLEGSLQQKARKAAQMMSLITLILFAAGGALIMTYVDGYIIQGNIAHDGPSNPLYKTVALQSGAWLHNYQANAWTWVCPAMGLLGAVATGLLARLGCSYKTFISSSVSLFGIISTVGISMFPFILPSSSHPSQSLTVWDSSSSHTTLFIMLVAAIIFMPIIISYTSWAYRVLGGKVTENTVKQNESY